MMIGALRRECDKITMNKGGIIMSVKIAVMVPHPPLIIPEVGKGEEKAISSTISAYQEAARQVAACHPDTLVILSPHALMYADYFHLSPGASASGDLREFGAPQVRISAAYDTAFVRTLSALAEENGIPAGTLGERGLRTDALCRIGPVGRVD